MMNVQPMNQPAKQRQLKQESPSNSSILGTREINYDPEIQAFKARYHYWDHAAQSLAIDEARNEWKKYSASFPLSELFVVEEYEDEALVERFNAGDTLYGPGQAAREEFIRRVQELLNQQGIIVSKDGELGPSTQQAIKLFQERSGLTVDGIVGQKTWTALQAIKDSPSTNNTSMTIDATGCILNAARKYIGQEEVPGNRGFKDSAFDKVMRAVGFRDGDPWCAYFGELVWKEGYGALMANNLYNQQRVLSLLSKLCSGSAYQTWKNFTQHKAFQCSDTPVPGAIGILKKRIGTAGHLFIVESVITDSIVATIEGNSNEGGGREGYKVVKRRRASTEGTGSMQLLGFIHPCSSGQLLLHL